MGLSFLGYVLEPPRVGSSNSAFTLTPNVYISNQAAFDAAYPSNESAPRTEYHVFVLNDFVSPGTGPGNNSSFPDDTFAWTKNEVIQRFDYDGKASRFKTYPGNVLEVAGVLAADSNSNRLKVTSPISSDFVTYPVRVSVGTGSGTTITAVAVLNDGAFTTPAAGSVQISQDTGNLNWNPADIITHAGKSVRFQRQTFYTFNESKGSLGVITDPLLLNPLPASGQFPLIRIGYAEYLTPVQKATEVSFSVNPTAGTVEWALTTGRLKFNSTDVANAAGRKVYYDGSAFGFGLKVQTTNLGTITTPGTLSPRPPEASDTFFRVSGLVQFAQTSFVDTLTSPGKKGIVQIRRSDGQVQFSEADQTLYGSSSVHAVTADLTIERGMKLRLFRTPVNLDDADPTLKDVAAFYTSSGAILAQPVIGSPNVFLPAIPVDSKPLTITVSQGTGSFTGVLPRMDVASPPTGLGYIIDYDEQTLLYANRKANQVISAPTPYGGVNLPDTLLFDSDLLLELETSPNSGVYTPLTIGEDVLIDLAAGMVTMVSTDGEVVVTSTGATLSGHTLTDTSQNFTTAGAVSGDYVIVLDGAAKGVYQVTGVGTATLTLDVTAAAATNSSYEVKRGAEVLADRFVFEVPEVDPNTSVERLNSLGTISNSPRLSIDPNKASDSRFRFGKTTFSSVVTVVASDGSFTSPASMPQGTVEVSSATGHLNFSQTDVTSGTEVYWSKILTLGIDYTLQPSLGFVELTDRMLEREEAFVTYKNSNGDLVQERAAFLIRKELVSHPIPTNVMAYNTASPREPALAPTPRAYRGGRPQDNTQVLFNIPASTVSFIGAPTVTDALPSGPTVDPSESVMVDYYVYEAVGGEKNFTVLQPPMAATTIIVNEGDTTLVVPGDRTDIFAPSTLLLVDDTESYLIASSSYASGVTTVTLALPQVFKSDFQNPPLKISSGPLRTTGSPTAPSYFLTEMAVYDPVAKGQNKFNVHGDVSRVYQQGTIIYFTNGTYTDFNLVAGSSFDEESNLTEVSLTDKGLQQYSGVTLKRSVRPVLSTPSASATTLRSPELDQSFIVFRRIEGQVGTLLKSPDDYTIDTSGTVKLVVPLARNEEIGIFYTGDQVIEAGRRLRASYTFGIVPNDTNGLLGQTLKADYTTYIPDTFFWRVETFTNFRGELEEAYEEAAKASVPTGGPTLENSSSPKLFEQGRESVFFTEGYLANEDLVARPTLKYFNDAVNHLEDALEALDGRVVGDRDGRFLFDGNIDNPPRASFADVTNQIDDRFKISPAPYTVTGPPFVAVSVGTYKEVYKASATSRFYPTSRIRFGATVNPSGLQTGDSIMDIGETNLTGVSNIQRRFPWAVTTTFAIAGSTVLTVDANGSDVLLRPAFANGIKVAILAQDGTVLVPDASSLTISGTTATTITLGAVPVDIPIGSTIRLATNDTTYFKGYRLGVDVNVDLEKGLLTYVDPAGSLLAWAGLTQTPSPPGGGEALDVLVSFSNSATAPERFPALDGGTTDDDGNRQFPVLMPATASEVSAAGYLTTEASLIDPLTGTLRVVTTPPFEGVGSLDGTGTIVTNLAGAWLAPIPQVNDIMEISNGVNGPSSFRIITAVGADTLTVTPAFATPSVSGFQFSVAVGVALVSGTATVSPSDTLTDGTANYVTAGVQPGYTVIITSGPSTGLRRQVLAVVSATVLTVDNFPGPLTATYRVVNPLETYGADGALIQTSLLPALAGQISLITTSEVGAIDQFFNSVFTDLATGSNGQSSGSNFTSVGQTFVTNGVTTSHLLFIRSGAEAGFYKIQQVVSETVLQIEGIFPTNLTGITYRVVKSVGLTSDPLNGVLDAALAAETYLATIASFQNIVATPVVVSTDLGAYATRLRTSSLNNRYPVVSARIAAIPSAVTGIESELSAGDRLYDKRYVWVDTRINLETGILVSKERAVTKRVKAQEDTIKQLTKLLSVRQT